MANAEFIQKDKNIKKSAKLQEKYNNNYYYYYLQL